MPLDTAARALAFSWPLHGWSRSDLLALAAVVVTVVIAVVPPLRQGLLRWLAWLVLRAGLPRRRYARWFARTWGVYENPYLDDKEDLDLRNTYVPLSFRSDEGDRETVSIATDVLTNRDTGNLVIEGAPGSGKTTLLRAYGVGVIQARRDLVWRRRPVVPFLIQLRKLARYQSEQISIADYLVNEILVSSVGMKFNKAQRFLQHALVKDQVLVMLDGLDEVTIDRYQAVHEAVYSFVKDHRPSCPCYRARIVVTCRRQNFIALREEWVPAIANMVCSLAPLRNSEIFSYLNKLRSKFRAISGPEGFIQAVRASGTLDLHRIPLILAMSVGLYARKDYFEIPSSIAKLYQAMIEEMLDRHRFKRDPVGVAVTFQLGDKYRFLREFALHAALGPDGFEEFARAEIFEFARSLAPDLDAVPDSAAFVEEIIQRSGLLSDVGDVGRYVFVHRSIQEFLCAEELSLADDDSFLVDNANDPEWRQVVQFYSARLEQRTANSFLPKLAQRNPELAGYCLAVARVSDDAAVTVLDALAPIDGVRLAALAAATMSSRLSVQEMAIHRLGQVLSSPGSPVSAISGEVDSLLPLLGSLAATNAAQIAGVVPQLIQQIPDDPRLIEPLWRCLTAPGIERLSASHAIVGRLLTLATTLDGFEELARQEPYTRDFLTEEIRRRSYPFRDGLSLDNNLVTLLAWADYLQVTPTEPNRYFDAKAAGRLARVEGDRRRTVTLTPFWPARVICIMVSLAAVIVATILLITDPRQLLNPYGAWTPVIIFGAVLMPFAGFGWIVGPSDDSSRKDADASRVDSEFKRFFRGDESDRHAVTAHFIDMINFFPYWLGMPVILLPPFALAIACAPLLAKSLISYIAISIFGAMLYWMPMFPGFSHGRRYYLYRPSAYIDVYDDPRSRHWLTRTSSSTRSSKRHRRELTLPSSTSAG
jgi:hypothetical protein